jgi:hypothetical protein
VLIPAAGAVAIVVPSAQTWQGDQQTRQQTTGDGASQQSGHGTPHEGITLLDTCVPDLRIAFLRNVQTGVTETLPNCQNGY